MTRAKLLAAFSLALACLTPAAGQDDPNKWRREVDRLLGRWSDEVGSGRLRKARQELDKHLDQVGQDPEALLDLARIRLAAKGLPLQDKGRVARLLADSYLKARQHADKAASLLVARDKEGKLRDKGGQRHHVALALGLLATQAHFQEQLRARRLAGSKPAELKELIKLQAGEIGKRRARLAELAGDQLDDLLRAEVRRRAMLRELDRLGTAPPPLGLADLEGKPLRLDQLKGKVVLVVFWSSELPSSLEVLREARKVEQELASEHLVVVGVNLDKERASLEQTLAKEGWTWRHGHGQKGLASDVARAWRVRALPAGVAIDHGGRVRYVRPWEGGPGSLEATLRDLLSRRAGSKG